MNESPFDAVATSYKKHVMPIFRAAAIDLIELAALQPGEKVLDVGTGPGTAAMLAAPNVAPGGSVIGVDLSEAMLEVARAQAEKDGLNIEFRHANAETLDFPDGSFDVVLSSFGLGTTDPDESLAAIRRVLRNHDPAADRPNGRLVLSQWMPTSRPTNTFFELLQKRRVAEMTPRLEWLRDADLTARSWNSQHNTPEAVAALLTAHGFRDVHTEMREYIFTYANSDAYIDMSISFPLAQAEFEAFSPGNQRMFRHEFNAAMAPFRGPNRSIISEDMILFAVAGV